MSLNSNANNESAIDDLDYSQQQVQQQPHGQEEAATQDLSFSACDEEDEGDLAPVAEDTTFIASSTTISASSSSSSLDSRPSFLRTPTKMPVNLSSYLRLDSEAANYNNTSSSLSVRSSSIFSSAHQSPSTPATRSISTPQQHRRSVSRPPLTHTHDNATLPAHHTAAPITPIAFAPMDDSSSTAPSSSILLTPAHIVLGPVMGKVTSSSARILLEVDSPIRVRCTLTPQTRWFRPTLEQRARMIESQLTNTVHENGKRSQDQVEEELQSPKKKLKTNSSAASTSTSSTSSTSIDNPTLSSPLLGAQVHTLTLSLHAFHPTIFSFTSLTPETVYLVEFSSCDDVSQLSSTETMDRTAFFRTIPSAPIDLKIISFSCDCASDVGRDKNNMYAPGRKTLWEKLYEEECCAGGSSTIAVTSSPSHGFDIMVHLGDQVYADAAFAKGEQILGVTESAAGDSENEYSAVTLDEKCHLIYSAYAEIYRHTWNDSVTRLVLACGSHLMQSDDHEFRNDYGSFITTKQDQLIAHQARKAFHLYQRQLWDDHPSRQYLTPSDYYLTPQDYILECSLHVYGTTPTFGILIMDNRVSRAWDTTCKIFPQELEEEEEKKEIEEENDAGEDVVMNGTTMSISSFAPPPHAHAYFGAAQWNQLYAWFGDSSAVSTPQVLQSTPSIHNSTPLLPPSSPSSSPTSSLTHLIVINPSPAFFLGSKECYRLRTNTQLVDKIGLGLHTEEQAWFLELWRRWKMQEGVANKVERNILFIGGDSHFGMHTLLWRVPSSPSQSTDTIDPRLHGSGNSHGPGHAPVPHGVEILFEQVLASAISSRRPKFSSFELWKQSLWKEHQLKAQRVKNETTAALEPYYMTHTNLLYAHNFVHITCQKESGSTSSSSSSHPTTPGIHWRYVVSDAHERELEEMMKRSEIEHPAAAGAVSGK